MKQLKMKVPEKKEPVNPVLIEKAKGRRRLPFRVSFKLGGARFASETKAGELALKHGEQS